MTGSCEITVLFGHKFQLGQKEPTFVKLQKNLQNLHLYKYLGEELISGVKF